MDNLGYKSSNPTNHAGVKSWQFDLFDFWIILPAIDLNCKAGLVMQGDLILMFFAFSLMCMLAVVWLWFSRCLGFPWSKSNLLFNPLILQVENVKLLDRYTNRKAANGTLYLTATHLIYVDASSEVRKETWVRVILGACLNTRYKVFLYAVWAILWILKLC